MQARVSALIVAVALISAMTAADRAAGTVVTLGVAGRANANVSMASSGAFVVTTWSAALPTGETDIYSATSRDSGRTFSTAVRVNSTPGDARVNGEQPPRLALRARAAGDPEIVVVWTTKGSVGTVMRSAVSVDGGRSYSKSSLVPGTDAPGNRGWEAVGAGPSGRFFTVWLDHRKLAPAQQTQLNAEHHHEAMASMPAPQDGVAMAQLSQLFVAPIDGSLPPQAVTGGVCYCCKTAIAAGADNTLYLAWRHVYAGNMRDIAFSASRDGGSTFSSPVRVSEDRWRIEGCPDDGPSMAVDRLGNVHIVWPAVVTEGGGPVKALFHAMTKDGRSFSTRVRIPTQGQANHPQLSIDSAGALAVTWDESGRGTRTLAAALGRLDRTNVVQFTRLGGKAEVGTYPILASTAAGSWLRAWTAGNPDASQIQVAPLN